MIVKGVRKLYLDGYVLALPIMVVLGVLVPTSGVAADILGWATKIAIGLMFFLHGIRSPSEQVLAGMRHWRLQLVLLMITFGIYPVLGLCIHWLTGDLLTGALGIGLVYVTLVPATIQACVAYTAIARGNVAAAVVGAAASNVLGVVITPLLVAVILATGGGAHVDVGSFVRVTLQLMVPFAAGQLMRPHVKAYVQRYEAQLNRYDRVLILIVVFAAFSAGTAAGIWSSVPPAQIALTIALCAGLLCTGLIVTAAIGKVFGFSREDRIVILFVGSSKALGAGLAIGAALFAGRDVALIILPLMIFHQLKLIGEAFIAQRFGRQAAPESDVTTRR